MRSGTDILLIFPPFWDYYSPFLSLPCLSGYLKSKGYSVRQLDLNIIHFNEVIANNGLNAIEKLRQSDFYRSKVEEIYKTVFKSRTSAEFAEKSKFIDQEFMTVNGFKRNFRQLDTDKLNMLDGFYHFVFFDQMYGKSFTREIENMDMDAVLSMIDTTDLKKTFMNYGYMNIIDNNPGLVGFSVTSREQFIVSCYYSKLIKDELSTAIRIVFGGSYIPLLLKTVNSGSIHKVFKYADFIICGEGETALSKLIDYCKGENVELTDIPNLYFYNAETGMRKTHYWFEDVETLPSPDFDGYDFSLYLAPDVILPYQGSRGCFWGQCAFCDHDENYRHNYRKKSAEKIVDDMRLLMKCYNIKHLQFSDEAIDAGSFRKLIEEMSRYEEFKSLNWMYYSRVSRLYNDEIAKKAYENGCRMVLFGVESFNNRILKLIKKGISQESIINNLKSFSQAKIKTIIWMICGFPSQNEDEVYYDIEMLQKLSGYLSGVFAGLFRLEKNCDMYLNPEKFYILEYDKVNPYIFKSHNNGVIIDQQKIHDIYWNEYMNVVNNISVSHNRYIIYFSNNT